MQSPKIRNGLIPSLKSYGARMSVIPLKLGESIVDSQDEFAKQGGFDGKAILVFNLERSQLSDSSSNVSYDLRVGSEYKGHRDAEKTELPTNGEIVLRSGNAVLIQSEEIVFVPRGFFGYVVPKVKLLQSGISNTLSKVDPGYNGPLIITLFNLGKADQKLKRCDAFCTLVLHRVEAGAELYNKPGKRITGNAREPWLPRLRDRLDGVKPWITLLTALISLVVAVITAIFGFHHAGGLAR